MRFSDLYPKDAFTPIAMLETTRSLDWNTITDDERPAYNEAVRQDRRANEQKGAHIKTHFRPAMLRWLEYLRGDGRLTPIPHLENRSILLADAWNAFVGGTADENDTDRVLAIFDRAFLRITISAKKARYHLREQPGHIRGGSYPPADADINAAYQELIKTIESGDSDLLYLSVENLFDTASGDQCRIQFSDWKTELLIWNNENYTYQPATPAVEIPLQTVEIDAPTGDLLLTDWFRIPEFTKATEESRNININSDQGAIRLTKALAERHGVVHVHTTNTYVGVHLGPDGRLMIAERWDERDEDEATAPGMEPVGEFSCDLWAATIIDKEILLELMRKGAAEDPEAVLKNYLEGGSNNIVSLKVEPGQYRVHFGPHFHRRANRAELGIPEGPEPWLLMERIGEL